MKKQVLLVVGVLFFVSFASAFGDDSDDYISGGFFRVEQFIRYDLHGSTTISPRQFVFCGTGIERIDYSKVSRVIKKMDEPFDWVAWSKNGDLITINSNIVFSEEKYIDKIRSLVNPFSKKPYRATASELCLNIETEIDWGALAKESTNEEVVNHYLRILENNLPNLTFKIIKEWK